ncbi:MAG TPA: hypothetical protein PLK12_05265 [Prolixibacteraceae bacterium]|nr:hypothetical protein [Prolixibacteraceae bacterium]
MKTNSLAIIAITGSIIVNSGSLFRQESIKVKNFPERLPTIELEEKTPQKYLMVIDNGHLNKWTRFRQ